MQERTNNLKQNNLNWLNNIGFVSQNTNLIDDTIEKNIAFGLVDKEIDQQKLNKAIQDSQLNSFISNSKDGIYTKVGEKGQMISGGQKQRIGIARALYKKSTVCWIATSPKNFGYDYHDNILCNVYERETVPTHYQQYNLREDRDNLPFGDEERIFDVDKIIESIKKQ